MTDSEDWAVVNIRGGLARVSPWGRYVAAILLLSLTVRITYALTAEWVDPFLRANPLHGDAGSYDRIASNLMAGRGYGEQAGEPTAFWPPLYPMFLASLYTLCGHRLVVARLVQAVLGAVTVAATAESARGIFGQRVAMLVGVGMAFYPHLIYFGAWLIADGPYVAIVALTLLVAVRLQQRPNYAGFALVGILLGLGALAKPAGLMLIPLLMAWSWVALPSVPIRSRVVNALLIIVVAMVAIAPWTVRNYLVFRALVPVSTNDGYTFYGANNPDAFGGHREGFPVPMPGLSEPEAQRQYYLLGVQWIVTHPSQFARLTVRKMARLASPLSVASWEQDYPLPLAAWLRAAYAGFLGLAVGGAVLSLCRWRETCIMHTLILRVLVGTVVFYGDARYTLPMVPSLVILASVALVEGSAWLRRDRPRLRQSDAPSGRGGAA